MVFHGGSPRCQDCFWLMFFCGFSSACLCASCVTLFLPSFECFPLLKVLRARNGLASQHGISALQTTCQARREYDWGRGCLYFYFFIVLSQFYVFIWEVMGRWKVCFWRLWVTGNTWDLSTWYGKVYFSFFYFPEALFLFEDDFEEGILIDLFSLVELGES